MGAVSCMGSRSLFIHKEILRWVVDVEVSKSWAALWKGSIRGRCGALLRSFLRVGALRVLRRMRLLICFTIGYKRVKFWKYCFPWVFRIVIFVPVVFNSSLGVRKWAS